MTNPMPIAKPKATTPVRISFTYTIRPVPFTESLKEQIAQNQGRVMTLKGEDSGKKGAVTYPRRPWQCLNFFPDPQGQVSFRPGFPHVLGSPSTKPAAG